MPRIINNPQIRTPSDILARASRPQNYSSFLPSHRDWRYASGVFVHEDNFDEPRQVSVWDEFDYDLQAGVFVREQRRCGRKNGGTRDRDGDVNMKMGEGDGEAEDRASWVHTLAEFRWATEGEEEGWECTRLVAVLRFSERGMRSVRRIVGEEGEADMVAPRSPFRKMGRMLAANERIRLEEDDDTPEPKGKWKDETQDFNMKMVVASLRSKEIKANGVPAAWTWFPDAVSVGTIFPPGIGLTATEIHVRRYLRSSLLRHNIVIYSANKLSGFLPAPCPLEGRRDPPREQRLPRPRDDRYTILLPRHPACKHGGRPAESGNPRYYASSVPDFQDCRRSVGGYAQYESLY